MPDAYVNRDQLVLSNCNVRKTPVDPNRADFQEFLESVRTASEEGPRIRMALQTRQRNEQTPDGRPTYEVYDGQCRLLAADILGITILPIDITLEKDDAALIRASADGNRRHDLTPWDWAATVEQLKAMTTPSGAPRFPTYRNVAKYLGVSPGRITQWLKVAQLPDEIKQDVIAGRLTTKAAEKLAHGFATPQEQREVALIAQEAGAGQQAQVETIETLRDEPALLREAPASRAKKTAAVTRAKRAKDAARHLQKPGPGARDPHPAPAPLLVTEEEREAFVRLAEEHGFEQYVRQMRAIPDDDPESFRGLRARLVQEVQAHHAVTPPAPRAPLAEQGPAEVRVPVLPAPPVFVAPEELAAAEGLLLEVSLDVRLRRQVGEMPANVRFGAEQVAGLRQAASYALVHELRTHGLLEGLLHQAGSARPVVEETHATAEGGGA